jgi:RNA polymerase sigma-70 factor, ECF subfamily
VVQDAYVRAYEKLASFESRAKFSTWLTRIAVHEALARLNRQKSLSAARRSRDAGKKRRDSLHVHEAGSRTRMCGSELATVLQQEILNLPENYRLVFVLRDVEDSARVYTQTWADFLVNA